MPPTRRDSYSSFALVSLLLDHVRPLVAVPVAAGVLAVAFSVLLGRSWTAESTFKPQTRTADVGRLGGLASQLGFDLGGLSQGESVDFFARLAESRALLAEVATTEYAFAAEEGASDTLRGTLPDLYDIEADTEAARLRHAVDALGEATTATTDVQAGLVTVRTTAPWRGLAVALNRRILEEINRFNLEKRQSQARAEREFTEARLAEARGELESAEGALRNFLERNRRWENSPELRLQHDNLQRRVDLRQQVYTSLAQAYERVQLDEVRNTPVITVIDPPEGSGRRAGSLVKNGLLGALLGLVLVLGWVFLREYLARERAQHPEDWEALAARRREGRERVRSA